MNSVVLLSGGIDSAVALAEALRRGRPVVSLFVDYGQRARTRENRAARGVAASLGVDVRRTVRIDLGGSVSSALLDGGPITPETSIVPARNAVLLSLAAAVAVTHCCRDVVIGCSAEDAETYPDCRVPFLHSMQRAARLATGHLTDRMLRVHAPLVTMRKRQIVEFGRELGAWDAIGQTWSCYGHGPKACQACPSCHERQAAFASMGVVDPAR